MATVVSYTPRFREAFERLNREWIETYFVVEEADREAFADPGGKIVGRGGEIFFVVEGDEVLGTCAVIAHSPEVHEIAKMAVAPAARGRGFGDLLMKACVGFSRAAGAREIVIVSNTRLEPAIRLYEKHGFVRVPFENDGRYARADIKLVRTLATES
jgi:ribosomal protein S18 acetylase RimI-like enzyme